MTMCCGFNLYSFRQTGEPPKFSLLGKEQGRLIYFIIVTANKYLNSRVVTLYSNMTSRNNMEIFMLSLN